MKDVAFGIIGLGGISARFAGAVRAVRGVNLVRVAARDMKRAETFARKFRAQQFSDQYSDVIADKDVDVVYIGLTNQLHFELTKECLLNHKAVICEKPLTMSHKDSSALVELAKKNQTLLMEALWTRCLPAFQKAQEWVRAGRIGEIKLVTANFFVKLPYDPTSRWYDPALGGGSMYDLGVYPISLATGILGEHPEEVSGTAALAPSGVDEAAALTMRFPGGALASLNFGFSADAPQEAWITGTQGRIRLDNCYGPRKAALFNDNGLRLDTFNDPVRDGFEHEVRHCAELFKAGKIESDLIPWKDTLESARIFDLMNRQWGIGRK